MTELAERLAGSRPRAKPFETMRWLESHLDYDGPDCLIWPFARYANGYGAVAFRGGMKHASRVMCILKHGESHIPTDHAAHLCGNGHLGCVHPRHIQWATPVENARHRVLHGTDTAGERNASARLLEADIFHIRELKGKVSVRDLASQYQVTTSNIYAIWSGDTWAHLEGAKSQPPLPQQLGVSGLPGVSWHKPTGKWAARARVKGKRKHIGLFETPEQAASARHAFLQRGQK